MRLVKVVGLTRDGVAMFNMVARNDPDLCVAVEVEGQMAPVRIGSLSVSMDGLRFEVEKLDTDPLSSRGCRIGICLKRGLRWLGEHYGPQVLFWVRIVGAEPAFLSTHALVEAGYLDLPEEGVEFSFERIKRGASGKVCPEPTESGAYPVHNRGLLPPESKMVGS